MQINLGKIVSEEEFESFEKSRKLAAVNWKEKRIILPEEFYNKKGPESLHWEELALVNELAPCNNGIYCITIHSGFDSLLYHLLEGLTEKGLMSKSRAEKGDFVMGGEGIYLGWDSKGEQNSNSYFPRVIEDAKAYVKYFLRRRAYSLEISQVIVDSKEISNSLLDNPKL